MARRSIISLAGRPALALAAVAFLALAAPALASAAPPEPCLGVAQISDALGDGHHVPTDVLSAWFSEDAGPLQAVIKVQGATPQPEHDDADVNGAGLVMVFAVSGQLKYVRATIPFASDGPPTYDYGTYSSGTFTSAGSTLGTVFTAASGGSVTIDVPAATGATDGVLLDDPFVVTYDGIVGGVPTWVDHAPGGEQPTDTARGADYVVGSCDDDPETTVAVELNAPAKLKGGNKTATITGKVLPERSGVPVEITRDGKSTAISNVVTGAGGTFSVVVPVRETTRVRAEAEGITSQTRTITLQSTVVLTGRRVGKKGARFFGVARPLLPGRLLLLGTNSIAPVARKTSWKGGAFSFNLKRLKPGRYQVVYIPAGGRAERSTSKAVRIR
jgi:hypothetical protein